jgi:hypothetical protein
MDIRVWNGFIWLQIGANVCPCEHGNESSGSIEDEEYLGYVNRYKLFKKDQVTWSYSEARRKSSLH